MRIRLILLSLYSTVVFSQPNSADLYFERAENHRNGSAIDSSLFYFGKAALEYKKDKKFGKYVDCCNQIGIILTRQDKYDEAKKFLNEALTIGSVTLEENHLSVATTYIALGVLYAAEEYFEESLKFHDKALQIRLTKLGKNNTEVATSYGNIGNVHLRNKSHDKAIIAHQAALDIRNRLFGETGVEQIQSYIGLANAYREKRDFEASLRYFELALKNRILQRGPDHKDVAKIYQHISEVYFLMNDNEKGNLYRQKAKQQQ